MNKVVIGLSGGVDSSVAAYLLKKQGYEVIALFMINWHETTGTLQGDCPWEDDLIFAKLVARELGIPFHSVDLSDQYRKRVVDYMFGEYEKGRTPNPDVLCNREIKFDIFIDSARKLGAEMVATGHYCRKETFTRDGIEIQQLLAGADKNKDQSYFLCQLNQDQLKNALFPIGHLVKDEVRRIAEREKLVTARKKDSQGICFVGKVDLPTFLQQKLKARKGKIVEIKNDFPGYQTRQNQDKLEVLAEPYQYRLIDGVMKGDHQGAHFFTIGQRKGLDVGGTAKPLYVIATDVGNNIVFVGQGDDHPGLYRRALFIPSEDVHWIRPDTQVMVGMEKRYKVRVRYRQPLQEATLVMKEEGAYILFDEAQRGITAGQFAAWYEGEELMGSGIISR